MRAFMSTDGGQLREASTHCDLWPVAQVDEASRHAVREAARILKAVEPQRIGMVYAFIALEVS